MGKISSYNTDTSPTTNDFVLGNQATGPTTQKFKFSDLITLFFNNVPGNTIKTPALALSAALDGTNGVKSQANAGTAGGTMFYINLGGLKILWCISSNVSTGVSTLSYTFTLPAAFFTTIQLALCNPVNMTTDSRQNTAIGSATAVTVTAAAWYPLGGSATTGIGLVVIGT